ncbi:MAG TPA: FtsW/RodA/SpoVE family cell cycle protein [Patescibacteria group bacterium]|nr:FtsW/RodA/SpoVE family cell cycle protein [Patescibacteria group bacterium]
MERFLLPLLCTVLVIISLVMLQSIYPAGVVTQLVAFGIGIGAYFTVSSIPFSFWKKTAVPLFVFIVVMLFITIVVGKTTNGSTRWISLIGMQFQPSQTAKPLLGLYLCVLLLQTGKKKKNIYKHLAFGLTPILLVFLQPDLGTALILTAVFGAALYFCDIPIKVLLGIAVVSLLISGVGWKFFLHDYQRNRVLTYIDPVSDLLGRGYHASQATISVGSGKVIGRGLGHGVQSGLRFLPERQTDFMFASYAEELGFMGVLLLFSLYIALFVFLFYISSKIIDPVGKAFSLVTISSLFVQSAMNIGMNIGLLPIAGVTLPFLSLGGSSVISILFAFGLISSAYHANPQRHLVEIRSFV